MHNHFSLNSDQNGLILTGYDDLIHSRHAEMGLFAVLFHLPYKFALAPGIVFYFRHLSV
jgi:hypothetical protein